MKRLLIVSIAAAALFASSGIAVATPVTEPIATPGVYIPCPPVTPEPGVFRPAPTPPPPPRCPVLPVPPLTPPII